VRVAVHRLRDGGVPEQRLYYLRVLTPPKQLRGEGVAQTMEGEALSLQFCLSQQILELPVVEVAVVYWLAYAVGKDKVVILPKFA
jgi:hypothetical protein